MHPDPNMTRRIYKAIYHGYDADTQEIELEKLHSAAIRSRHHYALNLHPDLSLTPGDHIVVEEEEGNESELTFVRKDPAFRA